MSIGLGAAAGTADSVVWAGAALPGEKICLCLPKTCLGLEESPGGSDIKQEASTAKKKGRQIWGSTSGVPGATASNIVARLQKVSAILLQKKLYRSINGRLTGGRLKTRQRLVRVHNRCSSSQARQCSLSWVVRVSTGSGSSSGYRVLLYD